MNVPLIGPVKAGKTTYIAALYNTFFKGAPKSGITFKSQPALRERLLRLHGLWVSGVEVERTFDSGSFDFPLGTISLLDRRSAELTVPDRAGESFLNQWVARSLEPEYVSAVKDAAGVLAFLHPSNLRKVRRIDSTMEDLSKIVEGAVSANPSVEPPGTPTVEPELEWDPSKAPTEVVLTDLLQFVDFLQSGKTALPIGIVVSAWDVVEGEGLTPERWIATHLPLLWQYLDSRARAGRPTSIYGISANGGDIKSAAVRAKILAEPDSSLRPYIVMPDQSRSNDMSLPLLPFLTN